MSCNGCRVLRKGCSESCILRPCLQWIESPEAQGHATVFVAKFFGRAGLMSFISAVPESQRPALFQSLLFEACGRTVNPVNGAVGLLWTGNWHICQAAVETVLRGGTLRPMAELTDGSSAADENSDEGEVTCPDMWKNPNNHSRFSTSRSKRKKAEEATAAVNFNRSIQQIDLDLRLTPRLPLTAASKTAAADWQRPNSPSMNSEESGTTTTTTTCFESGGSGEKETKLLRLFM